MNRLFVHRHHPLHLLQHLLLGMCIAHPLLLHLLSHGEQALLQRTASIERIDLCRAQALFQFSDFALPRGFKCERNRLSPLRDANLSLGGKLVQLALEVVVLPQLNCLDKIRRRTTSILLPGLCEMIFKAERVTQLKEFVCYGGLQLFSGWSQ